MKQTNTSENGITVHNGVASIPSPFRDERFTILQHGIFDDEHIDVRINQQQDFAYLWPQPQVDYAQYVPRVKKLGLEQYKAKLDVYSRRVRKIAPYLSNSDTILDIGAGDGLFLKIAREQYPHLQLAACERDQHTRETRQAVVGTHNFNELEDVIRSEQTFDVITLFHVLEHLLHPATFLESVRSLLTPQSVLMIEIPSLTCPLLSLYHSEAYQKFYFQKQHPFSYSHSSLQRLLEHLGFITLEIISFQRYGIENHLQWLTAQKPGGNNTFRDIFHRSQEQYIADLEHTRHTDSAIWVGKIA